MVTVKVLHYGGDGTYYLRDGAHELDGLRVGPAGATLLGPSGPLDEHLAAILGRGVEPGGALDVVVAAPKPVSVLLATEPTDAARAVVALHVDAVRSVVASLVAGTHDPPAPLAVGFTHGINRSGDPHLHTHVLLGARGARAGTDRASVAQRGAAAADALYLAALRHGLPAATGRDAWVGRSGATCVEGVDAGLLAATTTPRERDGRWTHGASKPHPTREEVRHRWASLVGGAASLGPAAVPPRRSGCLDERRFAAALGEGTVGRADVVRAWASACTRGASPRDVLGVPALLAPDLEGGARRSAAAIRDWPTVRVLGPRPLDLEGLAAWCEARATLRLLVAGGHRLSHLDDPTGAPARTWLAVASLDAQLGRRTGPAARGRAVDAHDLGRAVR